VELAFRIIILQSRKLKGYEIPTISKPQDVSRQCKSQPHKQHIWFFADTKANTKKPKELFLANARRN
jgi:hypothetical protein